MLCRNAEAVYYHPPQGPPGAAGAEGRQGEKGAKVGKSILPLQSRAVSASPSDFLLPHCAHIVELKSQKSAEVI